MEQYIVTLDIETENTGYDIMKHNKRILSVQMFDGLEGLMFYDGSSENSIDAARSNIKSQIDQGCKFVGFNIRNFDVFFIKEFLGIEIPGEQILEISEMPQMEKIREKLGKKKPRLVDVCNHLGIECSHKNMMDELSLKFKNQPDVVTMAKEGSEKWVRELGWSSSFSYNLALDRIAGGMAIFESFKEFVESKGNQNSFFYKYAIGDVISEYQLYLKIKNNI